MSGGLRLTIVLALILVACQPQSSGGPEKEPTHEAPGITEQSPIPLATITAIAGTEIPPVVESNLLTPVPTEGAQSKEITPPTSLDEIVFEASGGSVEQQIDYLRNATGFLEDRDGDGVKEPHSLVEDVMGTTLYNLSRAGLLEGTTLEELQVDFERQGYTWATLASGIWSIQPVNPDGEIGRAFDLNGQPFRTGMPLVPIDEFELVFTPMPEGGVRQSLTIDTDDEMPVILVWGNADEPIGFVDPDSKNFIADGEQGGVSAEVTTVLTTLDYDLTDHESYDPKYYTIETREWQGQPVQMLIHDNPEAEGTRIDAMEVEINGELRWVRGLWYETSQYPGSGGIVLDMPVSPGTDLATYFAEENGPDSVYGQFLKAIAHQRGIPESQIWDYIVEHDYKIKIRLPQRANGSSYSPSLLTESDLVEVDFSQPFYRSNRAEVNLGQAVNGVVLTDLPERALFLLGDSRERSGLFVDAQGALNLIRFDYEGSLITGLPEYSSWSLFTELELLAAMTDSFSDAGDFGSDQWMLKFGDRAGRKYIIGNTIVDRDVFVKYSQDYSVTDWSILERK